MAGLPSQSQGTNAVAGNTVKNGGWQENTINNYNFYYDIHVTKSFGRFMLLEGKENQSSSVLHDLGGECGRRLAIMGLESLPMPPFLREGANAVPRPHETRGESSHRQEYHSIRNGPPLKLVCYEADYEACRRHYFRGDGDQSLLQRLQENHQEGRGDSSFFSALRMLWDSNNASVLTIDGSTHGSSPTTGLAVTMIEGLKKTENTIYHICGQHSERTGPWPHRVVEHFLGQLLKSHQQNFDSEAKLATETEIKAILGQDSAKELWGVFEKCLVRANIQSLVIVLDQLDALRRECCRTRGGMNRFEEFIAGLLSLMGGTAVVKIMVTSMSLEIIQDIRRRCTPPLR